MGGSQTILVVGATGSVGEPVARRLLEEGFAVRLLARDLDRVRSRFGPDYQYRAREVGDRAALDQALQGCQGVHVSPSGGSDRATIERVELHGTATLAELAAAHGLDRLTYVSRYLTQERFAADHFESRVKLAAEWAIARSGVPFTIFKPTCFMETLPRHVRGRRAVAIGRHQPSLHMVAGVDFGRMVAAAFRTPEAAGRQLFVQGPEAVTIADALRLYCSIVAPGKTVVTVPLPVMAAVDRLVGGGRLRRTIDLLRLMQRIGEVGDPAEANRLLGAPTTTLAQWCRTRAAGDG
jgi:uncharacterized protein YbjT (DUF2867 family)